MLYYSGWVCVSFQHRYKLATHPIYWEGGLSEFLIARRSRPYWRKPSPGVQVPCSCKLEVHVDGLMVRCIVLVQ